MSNILPYQLQNSKKRLQITDENPQIKKRNSYNYLQTKKNAFYGADLLDEYKSWQAQRQITPILGNSALQGPFEIFMRKKTGNADDSIDKLMFDNGGSYLWENPSLITESNFQLFFPGMNHTPGTNFKVYKKFKKAFLSRNNGSFNFNYFNVSFCVRMRFDLNMLEFKLYLKDMIETDGENILIISLDYYKTDKSLYIDSFFDTLLHEFKVVFEHKDKLVGHEKRKGALQKRGFLYIRLITNLIRSTGTALESIYLVDAWEPMKGKTPQDKDEWQQYIQDKNWQGDFMGNGKMGFAKDMEKYGFYANFMKGEKQKDGDTYFKPWISGTATKL